ncbi:MAG: biotin--[acetyl-CoA-carboxylase] ligase [Deltaproteobacteria bacterium RIFCSPLOWO2_12_FULL_40_28]|nr:MAG: biotin--[acetyl-CoA-carboxylase] ligase [Deltaproteobacteria bacterium RIFCSPHIGHO2_02_FULL_40_28]OGQ19658.1 MAG: biotin--[acetyl-CoA-carboxylase] ligase [Deltaproteobacteria bacterium RIFCSPHIGHO2_12_FULL_40_32]OGQ40935.1 MAG: biotin--[acetyl-CoA-carboxylase] ligase [Deltaproteobacteria bacterium RIFCSPLOWO2_02_FULL_40_36]OGQ54050.1 MAG: biotin--[acetyl-CoA-carboxylase] ligase [Deltaproteobacteria bacterium RIFCSPLOWO2_12_FULL_40_28]
MDVNKIQTALTGRFKNLKISFKSEVQSTNLWAKESLAEGLKDPALFITNHQTSGYGREQRVWESPAGKNILISLVDNPPQNPSFVYQLTLVFGVAQALALSSQFQKLPFQLKWPNDLYLNGKKMGGILVEYPSQFQKVIIGVGININSSQKDFSQDVAKIATSLFEETKTTHILEPLVASILNEYTNWRQIYDTQGLRPIISAWNSLSFITGKKVRVQESPEKSYEGVVLRLDEDGFLILRVDNQEKQVSFGDITIQ